MKDIIKDKKIVVVDIETSGLYCGDDGRKSARILRIDATKIENSMIGESFSSYVACGKHINKYVRDLTGISNKTLKGAPRIKTVLKRLKEFTCGYEVYARNSEFINKFLSYYGNKNSVQIDLAVADNYDELSRALNYNVEVKAYLEKTKEIETIALASFLLNENI